MSLVPVLDTLETDRLILRQRRVDEAAIYRRLWTERIPGCRRIGRTLLSGWRVQGGECRSRNDAKRSGGDGHDWDNRTRGSRLPAALAGMSDGPA